MAAETLGVNSAHDPIGAASARLLAAGIARHERLFALRVLGLLLDHADRGGMVYLLPATLAGEFDLDRAAVETAFLHLRTAGVLVPAVGGWHIDGYEDYDGGGVNAGAALALIADLLEGPDIAPVAAPRPAATFAARAYPVLTGVLVVLLLLVAATGRTPGDGDTDVALRVAGIDPDDVPERFREPAPDRVREPRRTPSSAVTAAPSTEGTAAVAGPTTTGVATGRPPAPAPSSTIDGPPLTSNLAATPAPACPSGSPVLEVVDVTALPVPSTAGINGSFTVPVDEAGWYVSIHGTLENGGDAEMIIERFDVIVTTEDGKQSLEGLSEPVLLAPGKTHEWSVSTATSLYSPPPDEADVETVMREWRWADRCP